MPMRGLRIGYGTKSKALRVAARHSMCSALGYWPMPFSQSPHQSSSLVVGNRDCCNVPIITSVGACRLQSPACSPSSLPGFAPRDSQNLHEPQPGGYLVGSMSLPSLKSAMSAIRELRTRLSRFAKSESLSLFAVASFVTFHSKKTRLAEPAETYARFSYGRGSVTATDHGLRSTSERQTSLFCGCSVTQTIAGSGGSNATASTHGMTSTPASSTA